MSGKKKTRVILAILIPIFVIVIFIVIYSKDFYYNESNIDRVIEKEIVNDIKDDLSIEDNSVEDKGELSTTENVDNKVSNTPKSIEKEKKENHQNSQTTKSNTKNKTTTNNSKKSNNTQTTNKHGNAIQVKETPEEKKVEETKEDEKKETPVVKQEEQKSVEITIETPEESSLEKDPTYIKMKKELFSSSSECNNRGMEINLKDMENIASTMCSSESYKGVEVGFRLYIRYKDGTYKEYKK